MRNLVLFLCFAVPILAADAQFNGRWDIQVQDEARGRAWWLEVTGAGTPSLKGRFVGFPGGDMNEIETLSIKDGVLRFSFHRAGRPGKKGGEPIHLDYRARLQGDKLLGVMESPQRTVKWVGMRAPEIRETDDGSWREGKPIALFNGKDLSGWRAVTPSGTAGWSVENGALKSTGGAANLQTEGKFWNFILHVEYRVAERSNSGIGLRGRYEVQVLEDYGRPPNTHTNGALYSRIVPNENASKPAGEWQTYDIRLVGRQVTIVLNGKKIIDKGLIEGLTAMASDPHEGQPGPISLQGDHGPVEFRKIVLTPLVR
jgi:hypothetical protein